MELVEALWLRLRELNSTINYSGISVNPWFIAESVKHRTFDVHIRIKPNALIQGYTGRTYTASVELEMEHLDVMAVLERDNYVFSQHKALYVVSPDDVEVIDYAN